jgi:hypothetical protein
VRRGAEKAAKILPKNKKTAPGQSKDGGSYFATDFFAGVVSAWARASVVATSSQSYCHGSRSASERRFRLRGVVFDVLIGRKGDNHMVRSFPELVCAGEHIAGPGA